MSAKSMISVQEAEAIILRNLLNPSWEEVPLSNAFGRITAEDWRSDQPYPPFDRVMMDGIAIRFSAWLSGIRQFRVSGMQRAGAPPSVLDSENTCIEVMTGSVLPNGADTVIPYEMLDISGELATVGEVPVRSGQNIHRIGTDALAGELLVKSCQRIGMAEAGIAASIGMVKPKVLRMPVIEIVSTGDELVDISMIPLPHQIRRSNDHVLLGMLRGIGADATCVHLPDDPAVVRQYLTEAITRTDALLITGGVSKGKFDLMPDLLRECGVNERFHKILQKPGKPFWYGSTETTFVFAFPGNPVSAAVCAVRYFKTWLNASYGQPASKMKVITGQEFSVHPKLTLFTQVRIEQNLSAQFVATSLKGKGSGDFIQLTHADGFVEIAPGNDLMPAGTLVDFYPYPGRRF